MFSNNITQIARLSVIIHTLNYSINKLDNHPASQREQITGELEDLAEKIVNKTNSFFF